MNNSDTFQRWDTEIEALLRTVWLPMMYEATKLVWGKSWMMPRIRRSSEGVKGLKVKIPFLLGGGHGWRPMSRMGHLSSGSPEYGNEQEFELNAHVGGVQATLDDITAYADDNSMLRPLFQRQITNLMRSLPAYIRNMVWLPESGVVGVAASISGTTVTLDNDGLQHDGTYDLTRYVTINDWIQWYTSAGVKLGDPVRVINVTQEGATIVISSDPGVTDGAFFTTTDIAGLESSYNQFGPGIWDVVSDDNTFQGMDRSQAANALFRANVYENAASPGTGQAPSYDIFREFFRKMAMPEFALTGDHVIEAYYTNEIRENQRWVDGRQEFTDGFRQIRIDNTLLIADKDMLNDRLLVPDLSSMWLADKGEVTPLPGQGAMEHVPGRPFFEKHFVFYARLVATECQRMGVRLDINPDA